MTSLLIGCGNLGEIILKGFNKSNKKILVLEQRVEIADRIRDSYKNVKLLEDFSDVDWRDINYVMLCVKPKDSRKVLIQIKNFCNKNNLIISFIAGLQTQTISKLILSKSPVVRIMPNIFISSQNSATAVFSTGITKNQKKSIIKDFNNFGKVVWVDQEKEIDFFTAMFGGGPAYFFYILQCFNKLIKKNGFSDKDSLLLLTSLIEGTLIELKSKNIDLQEFIKKVASKGGTTEEALKVLSKNQSLFQLLETAIKAAKTKSNKISKQLK